MNARTPPAGDVLDTIDGALRDYEAGADAMRWTPPGSAPRNAPAADLLGPVGILGVDVEPLLEVFREASRTLAQFMAELNRNLLAIMPQVTSLAAVLSEADARQRDDLKAMHAEYHRRRRARIRRNR